MPGATAFLFWREKATYEHLIRRQGYAESDIFHVDTKLKFLSLYTEKVVFADEPDIPYEYKRHEKGAIMQVGMSDPEGAGADWKNYSINMKKHLHRKAAGCGTGGGMIC
ncbi:DUF3139 domain-containing protein [Paenibacillus thiaminolyticus]|nr:DUF3139 domain-containing protein [Paenibacillus thiaminolyticus]